MSKANWFGVPGELPPNLKLQQLIVGKWASQAVYAAAELGIADRLSTGPRTSAEIARECGANEDATYRLMRALSNLGVLDERPGRAFTLTPVGELLRRGVPGSMNGFARFVGYAPTWTAWGDSLHSVRTGEPAFDHLFSANLFDWYAKNLEESAVFDEDPDHARSGAAGGVIRDFTRHRDTRSLDCYSRPRATRRAIVRVSRAPVAEQVRNAESAS